MLHLRTMFIQGLSLQHFRNYRQQTLFFSPTVTVIVGNNAVGKTSILEAINLLSTGESFRATEVEEMIEIDQEIGRVKAHFSQVSQSEKHDLELELLLTRGQVNGQRAQTRLYSVNQVKKRKKDFVGQFFTTLFRPEDLRLIEGSPARRRQFLDTILKTIDQDYAASLKTYEESLKKRNRLLLQIKDGQMPRSVLTFWNNAVVKHGSIVQTKRLQLLRTFTLTDFPLQLSVEYQPSVMNEERLAAHLDTEIAVGHTLIGPHKDDFLVQFSLNQTIKPIFQYGSRGQQRLAVLWLKMCEFNYLFAQSGMRPILLLDDILSELDTEHQQVVLSLLTLTQSIITTTDAHIFTDLKLRYPEIKCIELPSTKPTKTNE